MAKLPEEVTETIWLLKKQSLDIVEQATATEFILFDSFGETEQTISYLDEMKNVAEIATSSYSRLFRLHLQIAQSQPIASQDVLQFLQQVILETQTRIPAWKRSIEEVKLEWNLS
jgi:hypothetical protein